MHKKAPRRELDYVAEELCLFEHVFSHTTKRTGPIIREVFENVQKFLAPETEILTGAGADNAWGSEMRLTALTVKFDQTAENAALPGSPATPPRRSRKKPAGTEDEVQLELFPENAPELGIMENTPPVIVDGVNLDVPTFMRNGNPPDGGR